MIGNAVLIWGIPSEATLASVVHHLTRMRVASIVVNQRRFEHYRLVLRPRRHELRGCLDTPEGRHDLRRFKSALLRPMDFRYLPELQHAAQSSPLFEHARHLHEALDTWANLSDRRVLNPPCSMLSNASKPFQAQLLRQCGFQIPETLVTNDPRLVRTFVKQHGQVIYKSISSYRSIVSQMSPRDLGRLPNIKSCPTQFQQRISGFDLRMHTIGGRWIATAIHTSAVDYRYAGREGLDVQMEPFHGLPELGGRCVSTARLLRLGLAGFDFRVTDAGEAFCLEVNPMPVFSYYEARSGQEISKLVAEYLAGVGDTALPSRVQH